MSLDRKLKALFELIRDEANRNPEFRSHLETLFDDTAGNRVPAEAPGGVHRRRVERQEHEVGVPPQKRGNRRTPAIVDPIAEGAHGETHLRNKLDALSLEQLRDVIADFRMDQSKLVMKWKDRARVIDHILATALVRREKGDVFRT
jgi:hypothetical protein